MGFMNRNSKINNAYCLFQFVQQRLLGILITVISALPANGQSFATTILNKEGIYSNIKWSIDVGKDFDRADIADFNNDGNLDVVAVGFDQEEVQLYLNDGNLNFSPRLVTSFANMGQVDVVDVGDIDGDGDQDIVVSFYNHQLNPANPVDLLLLQNDGNGNFTPMELISIAEKANGILLHDADDDGDPDVIFGYDSTNPAHPKLINIGINDNKAINQIISISDLAGGTIVGLAKGDVDGDGKEEIVYADLNRDDLVLVDFEIATSIRAALHLLERTVSVYPNPTSDILIIQSKTNDVQLREIFLVDAQGKMLLRRRAVASGPNELDLRVFPSGVYFVGIAADKGWLMEKVVRE